MEQISFNNKSYIFLNYITLGTTKYIFIFDENTKDLRCLKEKTLEEYSINSSFLPCDFNKKTIIDHFIKQLNYFLALEPRIDINSLIKSIKKFQFYINESELKHLVNDNIPYQISKTSLDNLNLFLSKTIEVKDIHELIIKNEQVDSNNTLGFNNKFFIPFYRLNINNYIYTFTYEQQKTEFKVFLELFQNNTITYQIPPMDLNNIKMPLNLINSNIIINYTVNRLNEELTTQNNFNLDNTINFIERITYYLENTDIRKSIELKAVNLTTEDIIKLFIFFDDALEIDKIITEPITNNYITPIDNSSNNISTAINENTPLEPNVVPDKISPIENNITSDVEQSQDSIELIDNNIIEIAPGPPISNNEGYFQKEKKKKKFNTYTLILIASIIIALVGVYMLIDWLFDGAKTDKINEKIKENVTIEETEGGEAVNPPAETPENTEPEELSDYWKYMQMSLINVNFDELTATNPDTVGWIQVNGTNINYPIVQSGDNDYYLHHAFDGSYNNAGWIFADYRNNLSNLSKNTVIYGHGRLDTTMFGSLKNILNSDWYNNSDNHVVKLSTPTQNTLWQVFSVYSIKAESYYITTDFPTTNQYDKFLKTLKERSVFSFSADVNTNDVILTLSTCQDNYDNRVVMHAKLIKAENREQR